MKMKVDYYLLDPSGNITLLVETKVPVSMQPYIASKLIEVEAKTEQVGFITLTQNNNNNIDALRMAGGEFCGNASMCASVVAAINSGCEQKNLFLKVSGASQPIRAEVMKISEKKWRGTVDMPSPLKIENIYLPEGKCYPVVTFEGISHVIIESSIAMEFPTIKSTEFTKYTEFPNTEFAQFPTAKSTEFTEFPTENSFDNSIEKSFEREKAESLAKKWCHYLKAAALGLMFFDRSNSRLTPLVYVPAANTLCWENSCASGSCAVGAFLKKELGKPLSLNLKQPGGSLQIDVSEDDNIRLSGDVRIIKKASLDLY